MIKKFHPTPQNFFSPRKSLENIFRTFFSINFTEVCTKTKFLEHVYRFFFPSKDEKETWGVDENFSYII
jgi:hypothetical protein